MAEVYRVTVSEVKAIFDTDMPTESIQAFIRTAHGMVQSVCVPKGTLTEEDLRNIELWLSAHFACIRDPIALRSKIGDAEVWSFAASVTTAWGKGLDQTVYGQQAKAFDTSGALTTLGKQKGSFRAAPREGSRRFVKGLT